MQEGKKEIHGHTPFHVCVQVDWRDSADYCRGGVRWLAEKEQGGSQDDKFDVQSRVLTSCRSEQTNDGEPPEASEQCRRLRVETGQAWQRAGRL